MEFWNLYRIVRKRLWMVLFLVAVTLGSTVFTVLTRPPTYKATATVRVAVNSPAVGDVGRLDWYTAGILFSTVQETILSRANLQAVIDQNGLGMPPDKFRNAIGVSRIGNSNLLAIEVKSTEPESAKRLANDIAVAFIGSNKKLLENESSSSIAFYEEQVKLAEQNYEKARDDFRDSLNQPNARAAENRFITAQAAYQGAQDKLEAVRLINRFPDLKPASVAMAEPALTPTEQEGRQVARYVIIALLVSLLAGIFIAMAIEYLDLSIKSPYEVSGQLGLAVIAMIPHFRRGVSSVAQVLANLELPVLSPLMRWRMRQIESGNMPPDQLPLDAIEAFSAARVNLAVAHRRRVRDGQVGPTQVVVASSRPRDGRTTMTAHLGIALSRAGFRVLLVDGDLRHPQLHSRAGLTLADDGMGLIQLLRREAEISQAIRRTSHENLSLLLAGAVPGEPGEWDLLDSSGFSSLLVRLGEGYDFVLVDSPALGVFTDGAILAARVGRAVLVVDATQPSSENDLRTLTLLRRSGVIVEGVIVNKMNPEYVNPMKLHSLPTHVVGAAEISNGNGHTANGHAPAEPAIDSPYTPRRLN